LIVFVGRPPFNLWVFFRICCLTVSRRNVHHLFFSSGGCFCAFAIFFQLLCPSSWRAFPLLCLYERGLKVIFARLPGSWASRNSPPFSDSFLLNLLFPPPPPNTSASLFPHQFVPCPHSWVNVYSGPERFSLSGFFPPPTNPHILFFLNKGLCLLPLFPGGQAEQLLLFSTWTLNFFFPFMRPHFPPFFPPSLSGACVFSSPKGPEILRKILPYFFFTG